MVRFKNRYFLCELQGVGEICEAGVIEAVRQEYESNFGERGGSQVLYGLSFKYFSKASRIFLLKVPRSVQNDMQTALALLTSYGGCRARVRILHKSGTIKKSEARARRIFTDGLHRAVKAGLIKREEAEKAASIEESKLCQIRF